MLSNTLKHTKGKFAIFRDESTSALAGFHVAPLYWSNWNLNMFGFVEGRKAEKNLRSKARNNNPHVILGGRRALSSLRHPCYINTNVWSYLVCNFQAYSHTSSRIVTNIISHSNPTLLLTTSPNLTPLVTKPYDGRIRGGLVLTFVN